MKKQKQSRLKIILSLIATLCVLPLVFSSFFSGYKIITSGTQGNKVVEVAIFDYVMKNDFLLALAFVGCMLSFVLIITIIAHSLVLILKNKKDKFMGITFCSIEIFLSIMAFICVLLYCNKNTIVATGPMGYADGISRGLSNKIFGLINGQKIPQIGNITMDQMMFDVTGLDVNVGDVITLVGEDENQVITIDEWAKILDTIHYELTCRLKVRLPRVYTR